MSCVFITLIVFFGCMARLFIARLCPPKALSHRQSLKMLDLCLCRMYLRGYGGHWNESIGISKTRWSVLFPDCPDCQDQENSRPPSNERRASLFHGLPGF